MDVIEKDGEIVLRDIPFTNWAYGVLLLFGFLLFSFPVAKELTKPPTQPTDFYLVIPFFLAIFALYWAIKKLLSPIIITRVNLNEKTVQIKRVKFPFGKQTEIYNFPRIKHFENVARKPDRAYLYFNVMILKDGACIDLESSGMQIQTNRIPSKLNEVLKAHRKR